MMTLLARLLTAVTGSSLLPIGGLIGMLTLGHQWWLERDTRMKAEAAATAKQVCEAEHQIIAVRAERDIARRSIADMQQLLEQEHQTTAQLRQERRSIKEEYDAYREAASSDPRCLSDGVLDILRGDGAVRNADPGRPAVGDGQRQ